LVSFVEDYPLKYRFETPSLILQLASIQPFSPTHNHPPFGGSPIMTLFRRLQFSIACLCCLLAVSLHASVTTYTMSPPVTTPGIYVPITDGTVHSHLHSNTLAMLSVDLGFRFTFDGIQTNVVKITPDGVIVLNAGMTGLVGSANDLSAATGANNRQLIAPLWDDMDGCGGGAEFQTKLEGAPGSRVFTVQWDRWHWPFTADDTISFQCKLYEATGVIRFYYLDGPGSTAGASASVGLSGITVGNFLSVDALSGSATASTSVSTNTISSMGVSELMLEFVPPPMTPHTSVIMAPTANTASFSYTETTTPGLVQTRMFLSEDGGASWVNLGTTIPGVTSGLLTNLGGNSNYIFRLVAQSAGCPAVVDTPFTTLPGTAPTLFTVGGTSAADSITGALNTCQTQRLAGPTVIELAPGYSTAFDTFPISIGPIAGPGSPLTIRPAAGATNLVIARAGAYPTIHLASARFVTIDGRPGGTGGADVDGRPLSTNLRITNSFNTGATDTGTVLLNASARRNTLTHLNIDGQNPSISSGVVALAQTVASADGIDNNTIKNCIISSGPLPVSTFAGCGIVINNGAVVTGDFRLDTMNTGNTIRDCDIRDIFNASNAHTSVRFGSNTLDTRFLNNRIYQTGARTVSAGLDISAINFVAGFGGHTITGNVIGPNPSGTGPTAWTLSGGANRFAGIMASFGNTMVPTVISGNTIQQISQTTTSTGTAFLGIFSGIHMSGTSPNLVIENNIIGSLTTPGSIAVTCTTGGAGANASVSGIRFGGGLGSGVINTVRIANNQIGGMTLNNSASGTSACSVFGIYDATDNTTLESVNCHFTVQDNTIGSSLAPLVAGGTNLTTGSAAVVGLRLERVSPAAAGGGQLFDISGTYDVSGNVVSYLTTNQSAVSAGPAGGGVRGILVGSAGSATAQPIASIVGNDVNHLSAVANANGNNQTSALIGIFNASPIAGQIIDGNIVSESAASPSAAGSGVSMSVIGIHAHGATGTPAYEISRNNIHTLDNDSTSATASIRGININDTRALVENNMVSLGNDLSGLPITLGNLLIGGIFDYGSGASNQIEHNSVAILGGPVGAGTGSSAAITRSTAVGTGMSIRNNIMSVQRSNGAGTGNHYGLVVESLTNQTLNGNLFHITGTGGFTGGIGTGPIASSATLSDWQTATSQEAQSREGDPEFINVNGGFLHIATGDFARVESLVAPSGLTLVDYDGELRSSFSPTNVDIGADAGAFDTISPTIAMNSTELDPTGASVIPVTATFSGIDGGTNSLVSGNIVVGGTANPTLANFAGASPVYTFDLLPVNAGSVTANIPAGVAMDGSGNLSTSGAFSRNSTVPVELSAFTLE